MSTKKLTAATTTPKEFVKLSGDDFNVIRGNVRKALLGRGIESDEVNSLMRAFRTIQPVYTAAMILFSDNSDENRIKAKEATDKAANFLKGNYSTGEAPF